MQATIHKSHTISVTRGELLREVNLVVALDIASKPILALIDNQ
jgi:hypothetical protein